VTEKRRCDNCKHWTQAVGDTFAVEAEAHNEDGKIGVGDLVRVVRVGGDCPVLLKETFNDHTCGEHAWREET
jgi:hypothetical protein